MRKLNQILSLALAGALYVCSTEPAFAQNKTADFDPDMVYGITLGTEVLAKKTVNEMDSLRQEVANLKAAGNTVKTLIKRVGVPHGVLKDIADLKKAMGSLGTSRDGIEPLVNEAVRKALQGKEGEFATALKAILDAAESKAGTYVGRIAKLEADMEQAKRDIKELKEKAAGSRASGGGINLAPEFLVVADHHVASFSLGAHLIIPAAASDWTVGLEGLVGVTHQRDLSWGVGLDVMKDLADYVSLGPTLRLDAVDDPLAPGVTLLAVNAGARADFHVGPVDFTLGGGMGMRYNGDPNFGWQVILGIGVRCF